jgi:hypothetical protein
LNNFQLEEILKKEPGFRGVFSRDMLPKQIKKRECGIVNLDTVGGKGTHWVCYFNIPTEKYVEYFDSFGLPPPEEVEKYLAASRKPIIYSTSEVQNKDTELCGYYCIEYILMRNHNIPYMSRIL